MNMAKKPGTRAEFVLFDVFYEDGSQRSNRKVPSTVLGGLDGDAPARAVIEEQDRGEVGPARHPDQERAPLGREVNAGSGSAPRRWGSRVARLSGRAQRQPTWRT
jgi:hypothetical protein